MCVFRCVELLETDMWGLGCRGNGYYDGASNQFPSLHFLKGGGIWVSFYIFCHFQPAPRNK